MALLLQAVLPISALAATSPAPQTSSDRVALCTQNGIVWVSLGDDGTITQEPESAPTVSKNTLPGHMPGCPLCPVCPYCPLVGSLALLLSAPDAFGRIIAFDAVSFAAQKNPLVLKAIRATRQPRAPPIFS
ncbi:MAG: hypothetical protein RIB59_00245 [Rhodospirillales bacterium]